MKREKAPQLSPDVATIGDAPALGLQYSEGPASPWPRGSEVLPASLHVSTSGYLVGAPPTLRPGTARVDDVTNGRARQES